MAGSGLVLTFFEKRQLVPTSGQPEWVVVLPRTGDGAHKPGSRTLVLGDSGCSPLEGGFLKAHHSTSTLGTGSRTAKPSQIDDGVYIITKVFSAPLAGKEVETSPTCCGCGPLHS